MGVRELNAFKSAGSYIRSVVTGIAVIKGMPLSLSTELTNYCNLHCPECPSGRGLNRRGKGFMDTGLFDRLLKELEPFLFRLTLYFQGESMIHPRFFDFLERARNLNTILSTNGHFINQENATRIAVSGLNKIIISVDGTEQETYSAYRANGNLATVMDGLKNIKEARERTGSSIKCEIQFLVNRKNEHQMSSMKKMAEKFNAELKFKSMQIINNKEIEKWLPSKEKYARYLRKENGYEIKNSFPDRCARLWFNPVITWDGKVVPCCFDKEADHIMGDINNQSFRDIWFGKEYTEFRNRVFSKRSDIDICRNCTSGMRRVKY